MNWFTDTIEGVTPEKWDTIVEFFKTDPGFNRYFKAYFKPERIFIETYSDNDFQSAQPMVFIVEFELLLDRKMERLTINYIVPSLLMFILFLALLVTGGALASFFFLELEEEVHNVIRYFIMIAPWLLVLFGWGTSSYYISQFRNKYYHRILATVDKGQPLV